MAMLQAGKNGPFAAVIGLLDRPGRIAEQRGLFLGDRRRFRPSSTMRRPISCSFELAGGDAAKLMGPLAHTLAAISLGAVFMGANTYIGNAPNFMVYAIARNAGMKMPGFFPYMLWSGVILLPLFAAVTWLFF